MTDITVVPYPFTAVIRTNFVTNARVATATTGWSAYTGAGGAGAIGGPYDIGTPPSDVPWANKHLGYSQSTTATDGAGPYVSVSGLSAGATYTASIYARPSTSRSVRIVIDWYNASSTYISSTYGSSTAGTAGQWVRASLAGAVSPAGTASANVGVRDMVATTAGLTMDVTCAQLEDSGTLGAFFDGSSPDADAQVGRRIYWTGATFASTSKDETRTPTSAAVRALGVNISGWSDGADVMQTIHKLLGTTDVVVTIARPSGPRMGTLTVWCPDVGTATSIETVLRSGLVMMNTVGVQRATMYAQMSAVQVTPQGEGMITWTVSASWLQMGKDPVAW